MSRRHLRVEPLESRRAPATLGADDKTVTYMDADGDAVRVTFSKPVLSAANVNTVFHFDVGSVNGVNTAAQQLQELTLTALPGSSVTVTVTTVVGNGKADVGWVNATGVDVGTISIAGDLGRMTAGDANPKTPAAKGLAVGSLGVRGLATQAAGGSLASTFTGNLSKLTVTGDVDGASVSVTGNLGNVAVGGALTADLTVANTGLLQATGAIGTVKIAGAVTGGSGNYSGVRAGGTIKAVTVGSLVGGGGTESAAIVSTTGSVGPVVVNGPMTGGSGFRSASVRALGVITQPSPNKPRVLKGGSITSVKVTGAVTGNGPQSATVQAVGSIGVVDLKSLSGGSGDGSAAVSAQWGGLGPVTIHGDIVGGTGLRSASVHANGTDPGPGVAATTDPTMLDYGSVVPGGGRLHGVTVTGALTGQAGGTAVIEGAAITAPAHVGSMAGAAEFSAVIEASFGPLASVKVDGAVVGGPGVQSGYIAANGANVFTNQPYSLGPVMIGGDLRGGAGNGSASIYASGGVGAVTIGGSMLGAGGQQSGAITAAAGAIGAVKITGDLTAGTGQYSGLIHASQLKLTPFTASGGTVASLTVGGSIAGGATSGSSAILRADRGVGAVTVGHDWTAASLISGLVDPGTDGYFGTGDDQSFTTAAVGPITVGGQFHGTAAAGDSFEILASQVAGLSIGGTAQPLQPGPFNDNIALDTQTGDFILLESLPNS